MLSRRNSPWSELFDLPGSLDRHMRDFWGTDWRMVRSLPVDIRQNEDAFMVEASIPGLQPEDVEVTIDQGILTIKGRAKGDREVEEGEYVRRERWNSSVFRQITLPTGVNASEISAKFENGVLMVRVPRVEKALPVHIPVMAESGKDTQVLTGTTEKVPVQTAEPVAAETNA